MTSAGSGNAASELLQEIEGGNGIFTGGDESDGSNGSNESSE